jgi:hypothetical protein
VGELVPHKVQGVVLQQQVRLGTQPDFQKQIHLRVLQGPQIHRTIHLMVQNYPKKSKKGGKMERKKKVFNFLDKVLLTSQSVQMAKKPLFENSSASILALKSALFLFRENLCHSFLNMK